MSDKFGGAYPDPTPDQLVAAGSYTQHYNHMRAFWSAQVNKLAQITRPARPDA